MKVLHIALKGNGDNDQPALNNALKSLGEYREVNWLKALRLGGIEQVEAQMRSVLSGFAPDFTFCQVQTPNVLTARMLSRIGGIKVNWTGDVEDPFPEWYKAMAPYFTISAFSNEKDVEEMKRCHHPAMFLDIGVDETDYCLEGPKEHLAEIVFFANNHGHYPLSNYRVQMVSYLRDTFGQRFAVFGNNWGRGITEMNSDHPRQAATIRGAKIAINLSNFNIPRYSSDRIHRIMGCGTFCLSHEFIGIEKDYELGKHLVAWNSFEDLCSKIDYYLQHDEEREKIARAGGELAHSRNRWSHRINYLVNTLREQGILKA